mgnify:CR=1 FL=1
MSWSPPTNRCCRRRGMWKLCTHPWASRCRMYRARSLPSDSEAGAAPAGRDDTGLMMLVASQEWYGPTKVVPVER